MTKVKQAGRQDQQENKKLKEEMEVLENKWKRALADYQNLEKRVAAQQQAYVRLASVTMIDKLLPVLDDLERASKHLKDDGLKLIVRQFGQVLESEDVKEIEVADKEFDPQYMDCMEMVPGKKNIVVEEVLKGYQLGEIVIRPAKVKVGTGTEEVKNINKPDKEE